MYNRLKLAKAVILKFKMVSDPSNSQLCTYLHHQHQKREYSLRLKSLTAERLGYIYAKAHLDMPAIFKFKIVLP